LKKLANQNKKKSAHKQPRAAEATRDNILDVALQEFSAHGLSGARVDTIAEKTRTTKRMMYYYFQSKEKLYEAVLQRAYSAIRVSVTAKSLDEFDPDEAISKLIELTFDYDETHPEFIRLVSIENIHYGEHIKKMPELKDSNKSAMELLGAVLNRGQRDGKFRADVSPFDVHLLISSFCFFRVSNQYTFGAIYDTNFSAPDIRLRQRRMIIEAVLGFLHIGLSARAD
jgi:AcrR family transcriptional regulator